MLTEPIDYGSCECDGGHEGVGASALARLDAPLVFQFSGHILDFVLLAAEFLVEVSRQYSGPIFLISLTW